MRLNAAAIALNQTPLDWQGNEQRVRAALADARSAGATLVCLPELCLTGYGCEDAFFAPDTRERAWRVMTNLLAETRGLVVAFGLPVFHQHCLFNVAALVVDGSLVGLAAKKNLAGDGIHYEPRWFKPWPADVRDDFPAPGGGILPIGDLVFEVGGVKIGFEICEDAWVAERPGIGLAARGVDIILNPSASHFAFGKAEIRRRFVAEGSRSFGAAYVYSSLLGNEAGRIIYDGQLLIAQDGRVIAEGDRFSFADHRVLCAMIEPNAGRLAKSQRASHRPRLPAASDPGLVHRAFEWPSSPIPARPNPFPDSGTESGFGEFTRAVSLGLFDYLRKSRSKGFVVSLSGGADSAAVVCLIRLMRDAVLAEPGYGIAGKLPSRDFGDLLTTVYQSTGNSGAITRDAARTLAEALGATHHEFDVSGIHRAYVTLVEQAAGRGFTWENDDIALQNIQARVRSPGVWMLANLRNALLVTTSNRSEAAVGYATMDGDTSGGLAPLSGIDKVFLREWLCWVEHTGPVIGGKRHPIPALAAINAQQPTAELRPQAGLQTDEEDLMPYEVLDFIEKSAIRDRKPPIDVLESLGPRFPYPPEKLKLWVGRFFTLWSRNQWKRECYAPGFHLDDENLDPKTWCRWPILSGSFQQELDEL